MATKFSELTAHRVDLARNLEAGFDNYLEEIARGYADFAAPLLEEGETAPDVGFLLELMKRGVARSRRRLSSFEGPVLDQAHEDAKVSAEIARRQKAVGAKMRLVRHICRGFYGTKGIERIGLKDEPRYASSRLYEQAKTVKESLLKPDLGLEPMLEIETGEDVATPPAQLAAELEPELSELGELVGDRHQENRKSVDVRLRRQRALGDFDREVRAIVRTAQGMFRLAGRDDLAERFRPILQKVTRRKKTEDKAEAAADQATGGATGEAESAAATEAAASEKTTA